MVPEQRCSISSLHPPPELNTKNTVTPNPSEALRGLPKAMGLTLLWQGRLRAPLPEASPGPHLAREHLPLDQSSRWLDLKFYTSLWEGSCRPRH